jgi:hypothetical protein
MWCPRPKQLSVRVLRCVFVTFATIAVISCGRRDASPATDTGAGTTTRASTGPNDWSPELGRVLLVPSDSDNAAIVLVPDAPNPQVLLSAPVTLLNANGDTTVVRVQSLISDTVECGDAPMLRFTAPVPPTWSVGFSGRTAGLVRMDSIEGLPAADSARLAVDLARLASALPMQRNSRFAGLPFAVLSARRLQANGRQIVVAQLVRRLNQEAAPLEERTLVIAERAAPASPARREPLTATHSQRSEGSEDAIEHFELLTAITSGPSTLLLMSRDQLSRTTYELLERTDTGWRTRWSRTLSC